MQPGRGPYARTPKQMWEEAFHTEKKSATVTKRPGEREKERASGEKIDGLGDEAVWATRQFGSVMHVLKGNVYLRLSFGGPANHAEQLEKAKRIANVVLPRLQ